MSHIVFRYEGQKILDHVESGRFPASMKHLIEVKITWLKGWPSDCPERKVEVEICLYQNLQEIVDFGDNTLLIPAWLHGFEPKRISQAYDNNVDAYDDRIYNVINWDTESFTLSVRTDEDY